MASIKIPYVAYSYLQAKTAVACRMKRQLPHPIPWVEGSINMLYMEVAECLTFGLHHAAIVLTGGFLEHILRLAVYEHSSGKQHVSSETTRKLPATDPVWLNLERSLFSALIDKARSCGIIEAEGDSAEWWNRFKDEWRNTYAHCKVFTMIRDETETMASATPEGEYEEVEIPVANDRKWWAINKRWRDEREALEVFRQVTQRFTEIAARVHWEATEPDDDAEKILKEKYDAFFFGEWSSQSRFPKFVDIPDQVYIDWPQW